MATKTEKPKRPAGAPRAARDKKPKPPAGAPSAGDDKKPLPPAGATPAGDEKSATVPIWRKFEVLGSVVVGVFIAFSTYSQLAIQKSQVTIQISQEQTASRQAVASLIIALAHTEGPKRNMAAIGLANLGERAIEPLILALRGTEPTTQEAAIEALVNIAELYDRKKVTQKLIIRFNKETENSVLDNYLTVLTRIEGFDTLVESTQNVDALSFRKIIDLFSQNLDLENLNRILNKKGIGSSTQEYVIDSIGSNVRLVGTDAVRIAVGVLVDFSLGEHDNDARVASIDNLARLASRVALTEADTSEVKNAMLKLLNDRSERIVFAAINGSRMFCGDQAIRDKLKKIRDQSTDRLVRQITETALGSDDCSLG